MKQLKYLLLLITAVSCAFVLFVKPVFANKRTVKVTTLNPGEDTEEDFYLVYGEIVEVSGKINGDVLAFGKEIYVNAKIRGNLIAVGSTVNLEGETENDTLVIAGKTLVGSKIGKNLIALAGDLNLTQNAGITRGIAAAASNITIDAPVGGKVQAAVESINLSNKIGSDVKIWGNTIILSEGASVLGNLTYYSNSDLQYSNQASISGTISRGGTFTGGFENVDFSPLEKSFNKIGTVARLIGFSSSLILGLLLIKIFPVFTEFSSDFISKKPLSVFLSGFIFLIVTPIISVLLLLTILGFYLGIIALFLYFILLHLSKIYFAYWIGGFLGNKFIKNIYLSFILGLLVFYLLKFVVVINFAISLTGIIMGLGSVLLGLKSSYDAAKSKT